MGFVQGEELEDLRIKKRKLLVALGKNRSERWLLRLWSQIIKTRDGFRCLCCDANEGIQAHHIVRKTLYPPCYLDFGNGVTLCRCCHQRVHAEFNGRPDLSLPLGAEQGDDQDEWAFLFGLLCKDAIERGIPEDEFYYLGDYFVDFSVGFQGYGNLRDLVSKGKISRIRFAHEIWRGMPQQFYTKMISSLFEN